MSWAKRSAQADDPELTGVIARITESVVESLRGDAMATASNILAHEMLFRIGVLADLTSTLTRGATVRQLPVPAT